MFYYGSPEEASAEGDFIRSKAEIVAAPFVVMFCATPGCRVYRASGKPLHPYPESLDDVPRAVCGHCVEAVAFGPVSV